MSLLTSAATETLTAGTFIALLPGVTIAIPISQERISPLLDAAARLLLVTRQRGKEVARREFVLGPLPPEGLARSVAELRVDVLLCAALSEPLLRALERRGVRVQPHLCGETEAVLQAFCCDRLNRPEFRMPGCWKPQSHSGCCQGRSVARNGKFGGKEKPADNPPKTPLKNHRGNP
jgi:predicted Fe-Mo cluster-binding NifX family protein